MFVTTSRSRGSRRPRWRALRGRLARLIILVGVALVPPTAAAQNTVLPQPCAGAACGGGVTTWVSSGDAAAVYSGNTLDVNQNSSSVTLNWRSFDVGEDGVVNFNQPGPTATALNRIFQGRPSEIRGQINANGRIVLINQNGVIFENGAQVNVRSMIASSLNITEEALELGIAEAAGNTGRPAFEVFFDEETGEPLRGAVEVREGATIVAQSGEVLGQIILLGGDVVNEGDVTAPQGQLILAAGDEVFFLPAPETGLRGLIVEVGENGGTVTNGSGTNVGRDVDGLIGRLSAPEGNVTLAGLVINQDGLVSADTSVSVNGSILLQAGEDGGVSGIGSGSPGLQGGEGGLLRLGADSVTQVLLADDGATAVDSTPQPESLIRLRGADITLEERARISAPSGEVVLAASEDAVNGVRRFPPVRDDSRVYIAPGARIDVAGATATLPVERNLVDVPIFSNEVRDSPIQRGLLDDPTQFPDRGDSVVVDIRESGVREDGLPWQGTPFIDASGAIAGIRRDVFERNLDGGTVLIESRGDVILAPGSRIDVSGGQVRYEDGFLATTQLVLDGNVVDIAEASPNGRYDGIADAITVEFQEGRISETFDGLGRAPSITVNATPLGDGRVFVAGEAAQGQAAQRLELQLGALAGLSGGAAMREAERIERLFATGVVTLPSPAEVATELESAQAGAIEALAEVDPAIADFIEQELARFFQDGVATFDAFDDVAAELGALQQLSASAGVTLPLQVEVVVPRGRFEQGYVEGKDAGSLELVTFDAILDGDLLAGVTAGRLQRRPTQPFTAGDATLYRPFDEVPRGGQLTLGLRRAGDNAGLDYLVSDIRLEESLVLPALEAGGFDVGSDPLEGRVDDLVLRPSLLSSAFGDGGFADLRLSADRSIVLAADTPLDLAPGARLDFEANQIILTSDIRSPGGQIAMTARTIGVTGSDLLLPAVLGVGDGVSIDVAGLWVNDVERVLRGLPADQPLWLDGGSVELVVDGAAGASGDRLVFGVDTRVDVSGGGEFTAGNVLVGGAGGSLLLDADGGTASGREAVDVALPGAITGLALGRGAALEIRVPEVCIAAAGCDTAMPGAQAFTPDFFSESGFAAIDLESTLAGLRVLEGTVLDVTLRNYRPLPGFESVPSGTPLAAFSEVVTLPDFLREPIALTLDVRAVPSAGLQAGALDAEALTALGELILEPGSRIALDPGGSLTLEANNRILLEEVELLAPGGEIVVRQTNELNANDGRFFDTFGIWLEGGSVLDVSGTTLLTPNDQGFRTGRVLDGGDIAITTGRGFVHLSQGSVLDASGDQALLDIRTGFGSDTTFAPTLIASDGGDLVLAASEALFLNGALRAGVATGSNAAPGGLQVSLDADLSSRGVNSEDNTFGGFPTRARRVEIVSRQTPTVIAPRAPIPLASVGRTQVPADVVAAGGFGDLSIAATNFRFRNVVVTVDGEPLVGEVVLQDGLALDLAGQLRLDAPVVAGRGASAVSADTIVLGPDGLWGPQQGPIAPLALRAGTATTTFAGSAVEFVGNVAFQDYETLTFEGREGIRFVGVLTNENVTVGGVVGTGREFLGSLRTRGDLTFDSEQLFPSTLSQFVVEREGSTGRIEIRRSGPPGGGRPLSVGGSLTFAADEILQAGEVRAPLGRIAFDARRLTLAQDSLTDTSVAGDTLLFGLTQAGADLVYQVDGEETLVFAPDFDPFPAQGVELTAASVDFRSGAVIDVRGGGEALAYEFVPGLGGTRDVLALDFAPGTFAILPGDDVPLAPRDPFEGAGFDASIGRSIFLFDGAGVPAGEYLLLPPRYALLSDDAFLVRADDALLDLVPGEIVPNADGSTTVAGFFGRIGSDVRDARLRGIEVTPVDVVLQRAQYDTTLASPFLTAQAEAAAVVPQRRPVDSGVISVITSEALRLDGQLLAAPGAVSGIGEAQGIEGRGVALDIAADRLALLADGATPEDGFVGIEAGSLQALAAESLLLGAAREATATGLRLSASASTIRVGEGVSLSAPELILAATGRVEIGDGVELRGEGAQAGRGATADTLAVTGNGALVRLSSADALTLERLGADGGAGTLDIAETAVLGASSAIEVDASASAVLAGALEAPGGAVSVSGGRLVLGDAPPGDAASAVLLDTDFLNSLRDAGELVLTSRSTIDVVSALDLQANVLALGGGGLRFIGEGAGEAAPRVTLTADEVGLGNALGATVPALLPGDGVAATLAISAADTLSLRPGELVVDGFAAVSAEVGGAATFAGDGDLLVDADLTLAAPILRRADNGSTTLAVTGAARVVPSAGAEDAGPPEPAPDTVFGGTLTVVGDRVLFDTRFDAPAGTLALAATGAGGVTLGAQGRVQVAGRARAFDGLSVGATGGNFEVVASAGDILLTEGAVVDLSAALDAPAGRLSLTADGNVAVDATLIARSDTAGEGGSVFVDAGTIDDFAGVNARLQPGTVDTDTGPLAIGGFDRERFVRTATGDLVLPAGAAIDALAVTLAADGGRVAISDGARVSASAGRAGRITLAARDGITVAGGARLEAAATTEGERGGQVQLLAGPGAPVDLAPGARVDVSAGTGVPSYGGGTLLVRVSRDVARAAGAPGTVRIAADIAGAGAIDLEAYQIYQVDDGVIGSDDVQASPGNPWFADAQAFIDGGGAPQSGAGAAAIATALGLDGDTSSLRVLPGVELVHDVPDGELAFRADWDLSPWRFADWDGSGVNVPGVLTVRATGDVRFGAENPNPFSNDPADFVSLSDGFDSPRNDGALIAGDSWSYRLVAGADLAGADPLAVRAGSGSLFVSQGRTVGIPAPIEFIRTGNGDIAIATGGDLVFGNSFASIYTAGVPDPAGGLLADEVPYAVDGGDISVSVGGDIRGALRRSPQLRPITGWLWRDGITQGFETTGGAWAPNNVFLSQNLGSLAGGDLRVRALGDIIDFSAVTPSTGRQDADFTAASEPIVRPGGRLTVEARGNVLGGLYFVDGPDATLRADGDIGPSPESGVGAVLFQGQGTLRLVARDDLRIEGIGSPLLGAASFLQGQQSIFSLYTDDSRADLLSVSGELDLGLNDLNVAAVTGQPSTNVGETRVLPPTVRAVALNGGISLARTTVSPGNVVLYPAPKGNLELFAAGDIDNSANLVVSDADPAALTSRLPTASTPAATPQLANTRAIIPVHADAAQPDGVPDLAPVRLVSLEGDLTQSNLTARLTSPKPVRLVAGNDLFNFQFTAQNLRETDVSSVVIGRDMTFRAPRTDDGDFSPSTFGGINILGPGRAEFVVQGDIDLGTAVGIASRGNLDNTALAETGADISLSAGLAGLAVDYDGVIDSYLRPADGAAGGPPGLEGLADVDGNGTLSDYEDALLTRLEGYQQSLVAYVMALGLPADDPATALASFTALTEAQQGVLIEEVLYGELRAEAERIGLGESTILPAVRPLEVLYPGSTPNAVLEVIGIQNAVADSFPAVSELLQPGATADEVLALIADEQPQLVEPILAAARAFLAEQAVVLGLPDIADIDARVEMLRDGDVSLFFSQVATNDGGDINLQAPGGLVNVGLASPPSAFADAGLIKGVDDLGLVVLSGGDVNMLLRDDLLVNESRVFTAGGGDILIVATQGDIDAGRGAQTALSAPAPDVITDFDAFSFLTVPAALAGSGIRALVPTAGAAGAVILAPLVGEVLASDAGIAGDTVFVPPGTDLSNIQTTGAAPAPPPAPPPASDPTAGTQQSAESEAGLGTSISDEDDAPESSRALGLLEVEVLGFEEDEEEEEDEDD